jgi:hypothetical protein
LWGRVGEGVVPVRCQWRHLQPLNYPHPDPSPQGGGKRTECEG